MSDSSLPAERGVSNRVVFKCELTAARTATRILRTFLAEQGLDETELFQCELCLAEACNNAVQYVTAAAAGSPVVAEAIFHGSGVELRVTDHTPGFELRERPAAIAPGHESGRGIFIIQSFMDDVRYYRGADRNTLVMRKARTRQQHRPAHDAAVATLEDARRQLESCQQTITSMARELCVRSETLSAIFRCSAELGRTSDLEGFGRRLLSDLLHLTSADWYVLRLAEPDETRLTVFAASEPQLRGEPLALGTTAVGTLPLEVSAALAQRPVDFDAVAQSSHSEHEPLRVAGPHASGVVQPLLFGEKLIGTLAIGRRESSVYSPLEVEMIRTFAEFMALQVVNARYREEQIHARIAAHELEIAHRIQRALLPRNLPQPPGFSLAANWQSARQVGGDFYDVYPLDAHTLLLVVADVMGKGVPAAMFATIMRSLLRALMVRSRRPANLLRRLNELLYEELSSVGMFITAQLVIVDTLRREVSAANAGHCPVLISGPGGIRPLRVGGTPLGVLPNSTYREVTAPFDAPAGLLLYTDGVTEALNPEGEMYGFERLLAAIRGRFQSTVDAQALRDELAANLAEFGRGEPLRDDQAFVILRENSAQPAGIDGAPPALVNVPGAESARGPAVAAPTRTTGDFLGTAAPVTARNFVFPTAPTLLNP
jgi:serine phosphatase RsbU (regulator of sigma subunit)/anti-sigma regulatory factor (Ser/Thr protein kinase)